MAAGSGSLLKCADEDERVQVIDVGSDGHVVSVIAYWSHFQSLMPGPLRPDVRDLGTVVEVAACFETSRLPIILAFEGPYTDSRAFNAAAPAAVATTNITAREILWGPLQ